jgi:hypothetical protein
VHAAHPKLPAAALAVPDAQSVHAVRPGSAEKRPAGQSKQEAPLDGW